MSWNATIRRKGAQLLRRFRADIGGVAALEYALIAPMMLAVLLGAFELTDAISAARRAENVGASIADVISRDVLVSDAELADVLAAAPVLMFPSRDPAIGVRISSIEIDAGGRARVFWSEAGGGMEPLVRGEDVTLAAGLRAPETGVVMVETAYRYRPPLGLTAVRPIELRHVEYRRPRIIDPVLREGVPNSLDEDEIG